MPLKESDKERTKLLATTLNTLGINTVVAGFVTPMIAFVFQIGAAPHSEVLLPLFFLWPAVGVLCHVYARLVLRTLDDDAS